MASIRKTDQAFGITIDPVAMPLAIMAVIASGVMAATHAAEWLGACPHGKSDG